VWCAAERRATRGEKGQRGGTRLVTGTRKIECVNGERAAVWEGAIAGRRMASA
jgi:hypothetical protein